MKINNYNYKKKINNKNYDLSEILIIIIYSKYFLLYLLIMNFPLNFELIKYLKVVHLNNYLKYILLKNIYYDYIYFNIL